MSATTVEPGKYLTLEHAQEGLVEAYRANQHGFDFVTSLVEQFDGYEWRDFVNWTKKLQLNRVSDLKKYAMELVEVENY